MRVQRRYWTNVGLASLLAIGAITHAQPILVAGAAGFGTWLLARYLLYARAVRDVQTNLQLFQSVARTQIIVDEPVTATLTAKLDDSPWLPVTIVAEAGLPMGATGTTTDACSCVVTSSEREAATTFTVRWPVAGKAEFEAPTVHVADEHGFFETTFVADAPEPPTVFVRSPSAHLFQESDEDSYALAVYGNQRAHTNTRGLEPDAVRKYAPGDSLHHIDWKATARSNQLHVRLETIRRNRRLSLFVDNRSAMSTGTPGKTKLAYARHAALSIVKQAEREGDEVGLFVVGDDGATTRRPSKPLASTYSKLRTAIHDLTPNRENGDVSSSAQSDRRTAGPDLGEDSEAFATDYDGPSSNSWGTVNALTVENSRFGAALRPFFAARQSSGQRLDANEPLYASVRDNLSPSAESPRTPELTVLLTDDTNRTEVREAVKGARRYSERVIVFLAPTVLFEPTGLADVERAYQRYTEFERFRRSLARSDDVSAFEIAPDDRSKTLHPTSRAIESTR